jgi:hypothetical protein
MRQGLTEWAVVTAVLVLAAAAGALRHGDEIRAAFGVRPPVAGAAAPAYPSAPWPLR